MYRTLFGGKFYNSPVRQGTMKTPTIKTRLSKLRNWKTLTYPSQYRLSSIFNHDAISRKNRCIKRRRKKKRYKEIRSKTKQTSNMRSSIGTWDWQTGQDIVPLDSKPSESVRINSRNNLKRTKRQRNGGCHRWENRVHNVSTIFQKILNPSQEWTKSRTPNITSRFEFPREIQEMRELGISLR